MAKMRISYLNSEKKELVNVDHLRAIRVDTFMFIYDKEINICSVYTENDDLKAVGEFDTDVFDSSVCREWIKNHVCEPITLLWWNNENSGGKLMKINLRKTENIEIGDIVTDSESTYLLCESENTGLITLVDLKRSITITTNHISQIDELEACIEECKLKLVAKGKEVAVQKVGNYEA